MNSAQIENRVDDLDLLISMFPIALSTAIRALADFSELTEIVMDLGRIPEVRYDKAVKRLHYLKETTLDDINSVVQRIGQFNSDNRAGIERTLHRISAIRNRTGKVIGLTCRVGRAVEGTIEVIRDILEERQNVLFLGPPGIGKTTKLRETARVLADEFNKRVLIVDTSNEIGGDGDIPHPGIGCARRMQVPSPDRQHAIMIEAVENHMPEVVIVDEIGTEEEAAAARTIAERGVQLIATAHGHTMENLLKNPTLSDLLGGIQSVILGDEEAKFRGTQKTILERKTLPTFDVLIEIVERDKFMIYDDVKLSVDAYLRGYEVEPEVRYRTDEGKMEKVAQSVSYPADEEKQELEPLRVFPFAINTGFILGVAKALDIPVEIAQSIGDADMILTTQSKMKSKGKVKINQLLQDHEIPLHVLTSNSREQLMAFFQDHFKLETSEKDTEAEALQDIQDVCKQVIHHRMVLEASPRNAQLRRLQHHYVDSQNLNSLSVGEEPNRRVRVYPR